MSDAINYVKVVFPCSVCHYIDKDGMLAVEIDDMDTNTKPLLTQELDLNSVVDFYIEMNSSSHGLEISDDLVSFQNTLKDVQERISVLIKENS